MSKSKPFENIGIDFCGPFYVRCEHDRPPKKVYVCLYACAVVRAVHLEVTESLSTKDFLLCFRRFKARRGVPSLIYFDNAAALQCAAQDVEGLSELLMNSDLQEEMSYQGVQWIFGVPNAPWMNGFIERLVGVIKNCMKRVIGKETLTYQEFVTVLYEIEDTVNRRPIVQVVDDVDQEVLTPMHFLLQEVSNGLNDSHLQYPDRTSELVKRWRNRKHIVEQFWRKWEHEYLAQLRTLQARDAQRSSSPRIGDVVILGDTKTPRLWWRLARVKEVRSGRDGVPRSCLLSLPNGTTLLRPMRLIYNLEIIQ